MTNTAGSTPLLQIDGLVAGYGKLAVLHDVSLSLARGSMLAVIGPNGAGKSTLTKAIMRLAVVMGGTVRFGGRNIETLATQDISALGIGYVPQTRNVFGALTIEENLELSCNLLKKSRRGEAVAGIYDRFPRLKERRRQRGSSLSGGERQMLAIGSALVSDPDLIILDEPTSGLSPHMTGEVVEAIKAINGSGKTVIWVVEENPRPVLALSDFVCVMDAGSVRRWSTAAEILAADDFRALFLGV